MNIANMQLLATALVSTKYFERVPSNSLKCIIPNQLFYGKQMYGYTVNGVMADIYIIQNPKLAYWEDDADSRFPSKFILKAVGEPWRLDIPQEVLDWYGLTREQSNQLWVMSARGYTFQQIGEAIMRSIKVAKR